MFYRVTICMTYYIICRPPPSQMSPGNTGIGGRATVQSVLPPRHRTDSSSSNQQAADNGAGE
jgi:hypothetical protein